MGESGRKALVNLSNVTIRGIGEWDFSRTIKEIDDNEFGITDEQYDVGLTGTKGTFKGKVRLTDAGQAALEEASENGTKIPDLRFYINDTVYYAPKTDINPDAAAVITSLKIGTKLDGVALIDIGVSFSGGLKKYGV